MENGNENKGLAIVPQLAQLNHIKFAKDLGDSIKEGDVDPLVVHIFLKRIENIQKILKEDKEVGSAIKIAAGMHDGTGKQFSFMGAKLALTSVHTAYAFDQCNDTLWTNLNEIFQQVQSLGNYAAIIRSMDNSIFELASSYDVIDDNHPEAEKFKQHIGDLISLSAILLSRYENDIENLSDVADGLSASLLEALG